MWRTYSTLVMLALLAGGLLVSIFTTPLPPSFHDSGEKLVEKPALTFDKEMLSIETKDGSLSFTVEMAETKRQRTRGLQHRETMAAEAGMLFLFDYPQPVSMWMADTLIPLDMLFIREDGRIASIAENTVPGSLDTIDSHIPVSSVLELNAGTTKKRGISVGDKVVYSKHFKHWDCPTSGECDEPSKSR